MHRDVGTLAGVLQCLQISIMANFGHASYNMEQSPLNCIEAVRAKASTFAAEDTWYCILVSISSFGIMPKG
jgi:hypothetical protein